MVEHHPLTFSRIADKPPNIKTDKKNEKVPNHSDRGFWLYAVQQ